ncbi:hypothetical protein [Streptomyces sp. NPDC014006]|uniref:hypothetical protein n=1 Tax=Streptomyces sp. NPDC014006 TaxID=3364870 RepID=UPI0036F54FD4
MAGRGRASGVSVLVSVCLLLVGCGGRPGADGVRAEVQRLLDRRAEAVLHHDAAGYGATGTRAGFAAVREVPLTSWSYRVTGVRRSGATATVDAELRYRVRDYDQAPVTAGRTLTLTRSPDGRWSVAADRPAPNSADQLWDQGTVRVVRGQHSLVLGVGRPDGQLRAYVSLADRAVPAVTDAWGANWPGRIVVLVPKSLDGMARLLGSPASSYRGIAAVTTGETGAPAKAAADRVIVNPDAYGMLGTLGRQVVLTHETTHVATRRATDAATPLWLSEGYADWVGYRGSGRTAVQAAPELQRAVADGEVPAALPGDRDFGFAGDAGRLARAYESGWLACRMIAERWGEARLRAFYRAVGEHRVRAGAVEDAMRTTLGVTLPDFTAQWRDYLRVQLG